MDYKKSSLWRNSIGNDSLCEKALREKLQYEYELARNNSAYLLDKIRKDFPQLTIHDITHVDNLWFIASTITGAMYEINPLEGFVLGCTFLVHDAVLSYDAVGGEENLRNTAEWKDYYADYDCNVDENQKVLECDFKTIRLLHAHKAEEIFKKEFWRADGTGFYIIDDISIRNHLGEIIGQIAASHHWNLDDVEKLGAQYGVLPGFPASWNINPIKLACILRCADAGHIDGDRAPDSIIMSMPIVEGSKDHWIAQNKLSSPMPDRFDPEKIVITSNQAFEEKDFNAWNLAYDMISLLNDELNKSNELLNKMGIPLFQAKSVRGAESQEELASYVKTKGWQPCDAQIHISNVENLITALGGEKLYGKENKLEIVLRELIQNARDAIVARRNREKDFVGKIIVKIFRDEDKKVWVEVTDDGIGMSISTVKEYLLNFGASFWKSDLMKSEFPGLNSSGFKSIGEFGIGFYSVFMVAKEVFVETRKYDKGLDTTIQLKFRNGFCLRPLLSNIRSSDTKYSTKIRFVLDNKILQWTSMKQIKPYGNMKDAFEVPYYAVISNMVAGLDVDVYYSELNSEEKMIHRNINLLEERTLEVANWLKDISYSDFRNTDIYNKYIDNNYMRLKKVYNGDGSFKGLIALNTFWKARTQYLAVETVGGLSTFVHPIEVGGYIGCLLTEPETARRNGVNYIFDMHDWAKNQLDMIVDGEIKIVDRIFLPYALSPYNIDISAMAMLYGYRANIKQLEWRCLPELIGLLKDTGEKLSFIISTITGSPRVENYIDIKLYNECAKEGEWMFIPVENSSFLSLQEGNGKDGYSILDYINFVAKDIGVVVHKKTEENRINTIRGEACSVLKLGFATL